MSGVFACYSRDKLRGKGGSIPPPAPITAFSRLLLENPAKLLVVSQTDGSETQHLLPG